MTLLIHEAFASGVTFSPSDGSRWFERLLSEVVAQREATLAGLALRLSSDASASEHRQAAAQFAAEAEAFSGRPAEQRRIVAEDPRYLIWLLSAVRLVTQHGETDATLLRELADFGPLCARILADHRRPDDLRVGGLIPVRRFDVDERIAAVAPPTYTFPAQRPDSGPGHTAYSLPFFAEVATAATTRIGQRWPELGPLLHHFIKLLVHVPDGDFRSASAARYTGVVFLTSDDMTLLDLEESIVHEYGHQVLYRVMELDPIVRDQAGDFSLPWSGATRDFYGYFHAFYVYLLLAEYFRRAIEVADSEEQQRAVARREAVTKGIGEAVRDFESERFTELGRQMLGLLVARARQATDGDVAMGEVTA